MAKKVIKEKSIEETLWESANKLRGSVEPSEYKHVVLSLIFLKYANDRFLERRNELIKDGKRIPISVECKFEKFYSQWDVADSPFVDMITSAEEFEYTIAEAPKTGDNAFDTIALCLGGMAVAVSLFCFVRRRREQ